jgi:hypothetical protein
LGLSASRPRPWLVLILPSISSHPLQNGTLLDLRLIGLSSLSQSEIRVELVLIVASLVTYPTLMLRIQHGLLMLIEQSENFLQGTRFFPSTAFYSEEHAQPHLNKYKSLKCMFNLLRTKFYVERDSVPQPHTSLSRFSLLASTLSLARIVQLYQIVCLFRHCCLPCPTESVKQRTSTHATLIPTLTFQVSAGLPV